MNTLNYFIIEIQENSSYTRGRFQAMQYDWEEKLLERCFRFPQSNMAKWVLTVIAISFALTLWS